jgi:hypothetical protein
MSMFRVRFDVQDNIRNTFIHYPDETFEKAIFYDDSVIDFENRCYWTYPNWK